MQFSLDSNLIFTRSYRSALLITTPTPSQVKASLYTHFLYLLISFLLIKNIKDQKAAEFEIIAFPYACYTGKNQCERLYDF